jgi:hypothetical protein
MNRYFGDIKLKAPLPCLWKLLEVNSGLQTLFQLRRLSARLEIIGR